MISTWKSNLEWILDQGIRDWQDYQDSDQQDTRIVIMGLQCIVQMKIDDDDNIKEKSLFENEHNVNKSMIIYSFLT